MTADEPVAAGDRNWFLDHPRRRYRLRPSAEGAGSWGLIRQRGGYALLRTTTRTVPHGTPDTDNALQRLWVATAWHLLSADAQAELVKEIKKREPTRFRRAAP